METEPNQLPSVHDDAVVDFLRRHHRVFLFGRDEQRRPIGYPMTSIEYRGGVLYFSTYAKSRKVDHFRVDPEAACLVMATETTNTTMPWMSVHGRVEIRTPTTAEVDEMIGRQSADDRVPQDVVAKVRDRMLRGKRVWLCVVLDGVWADGVVGNDGAEGNSRGT